MTAFPDSLTPQTFIPYAAGCALEKLTAGQSPREVERYLEELYEAYADHEPRAYDGDLELDDGFVPVESYHAGLGFVNDEGEAGMDMAMLKLQRLSLLPQESPIAGHPLIADQPAEHILSHDAFTQFTAGDLESKKQAIVAFAAAAADGANPIGPTWLGPIAPYVSQS